MPIVMNPSSQCNSQCLPFSVSWHIQLPCSTDGVTSHAEKCMFYLLLTKKNVISSSAVSSTYFANKWLLAIAVEAIKMRLHVIAAIQVQADRRTSGIMIEVFIHVCPRWKTEGVLSVRNPATTLCPLPLVRFNENPSDPNVTYVYDRILLYIQSILNQPYHSSRTDS